MSVIHPEFSLSDKEGRAGGGGGGVGGQGYGTENVPESFLSC